MKRITILILLAGTAQADNTTVYDEDLNYRGQIIDGNVYDDDNDYRGTVTESGDLYDGGNNYRGRIDGDEDNGAVLLIAPSE